MRCNRCTGSGGRNGGTGQRRIAAPVEEQQRLFALVQPVLQLFDQRRGDPVVAFGRMLGEVDDLDIGQAGAPEARGQIDLLVDPRLGQLHRFERGVALASTTGICSKRARITATSRAL
jgi:hypothetical protein